MTIVQGDPLPSLLIGPVDPAPMKVMALLLRDPNPIHLDPVAAGRYGGDRRVIGQGPVSLGYVTTMLTEWGGPRLTVRELRCRYMANVRAGDRLAVSGRVRSVEREGESAVVGCDVWVDIRDGARVLEGFAKVAVPLEADP